MKGPVGLQFFDSIGLNKGLKQIMFSIGKTQVLAQRAAEVKNHLRASLC